jgi:hypothetical protein
MADWTKKITKAVGGDLAADEHLEDGVFLNPSGTTSGMMGRQAGGLIGAAVAAKMQKNKTATSTLVTDAGLAADWLSKPVVVGLTGRRMLLWSHSQMSGKPKELIGEIPLENVASFSVEKKKATFDTTITFTDGSGILLEAPKIANKPERFAASFSRVTGR